MSIGTENHILATQACHLRHPQASLQSQEEQRPWPRPGESPKHIARWLNLLADLQMELTGQTDAAAVTLQRIVELFPNHSLAQKATERIGGLKQELKRFEEQRVVKFTSTAPERPEPPPRRRW